MLPGYGAGHVGVVAVGASANEANELRFAGLILAFRLRKGTWKWRPSGCHKRRRKVTLAR